MVTKRVTVSYEAVPGHGDWDRIKADLERQLPLKNLHWKSANRTIRTIQSLELDFKPFSFYKDEQSNASPSRLLERPYLHLLFVVCDDNEIYRASVRSQIRFWLDKVLTMQNQEWLIINVTTTKIAGSKFYQRKGSVLDKIRADFNTGKRDRCVQVAQSTPAEDPTAWAEFTTRVKEGIISRFDTNITLYEEDVRKADSQRILPGWNFCSFFTQKEALADCFEGLNLVEDALIQYDELEAAFFQTLKENKLAWSAESSPISTGDDALHFLSTHHKSYRDLIHSNTISVFDFRIYLFSRQAALLFSLGRVTDLAKRGASFISSLARTLRESPNAIGKHFIESWTYSTSLHLVEECRTALSREIAPPDAASFTAIKAELLELARKQLDKIGIDVGHLPLQHPFSMSLEESISSPLSTPTIAIGKDRPSVSRKDLLSATTDRGVFDKIYIDLTNRCIKAYQTSKRKRCALKLYASLAALESNRSRPTQSLKLYAPLPAHYVNDRWSLLESSLVSECITLQQTLDMSKERLLSTLALVRTGVEFGGKTWGLDLNRGKETVRSSLADKLMKEIYDLSALLTKDFAAVAFPTFSMRLSSEKGSTAADEDGVTVALTIKSLLPCTIKVDEVRLKFTTSDGEQIWFTAGSQSLPNGETEVVLFCPTAITGKLQLELSQIRFSRIIFQYSHRLFSDRNLAPDPHFTPHSSNQPFVIFERDRQALDIYLELPRAIHLDQDRQGIICIATGRNQLVKVTVRLTMTHPEARFALDQAHIIAGDAQLSASTTEEVLIIEDVKAFSTVQIQLPILEVSHDVALEVNIVAEYFTSKRPTTRRTLRRMASYPVALPLAVTVQDFFRKDCLLSKFSVTTDGFNALRVRSAELISEGDVSIKACRGVDVPDVTILPLQTANFLFKIIRREAVISKEPLQLTLKYRPIQEEFTSLVKAVMSKVIESSQLSQQKQFLTDRMIPLLSAATNLHWFGIGGSLVHLAFDEARWSGIVGESFRAEDAKSILECIAKIYEALRQVTLQDIPDEWRILTIPVELPSLSILNLVHIATAVQTVSVGTPISAVLSIRPTLAWASSTPPSPLALFYDVTGHTDDWLISGRKKGEFSAENEQETKINLTLIPLRSGSLFLPSVSVRPAFSTFGQEVSCETQHLSAARSLTVLPVTTRATFSIELDAIGRSRIM